MAVIVVFMTWHLNYNGSRASSTSSLCRFHNTTITSSLTISIYAGMLQSACPLLENSSTKNLSKSGEKKNSGKNILEKKKKNMNMSISASQSTFSCIWTLKRMVGWLVWKYVYDFDFDFVSFSWLFLLLFVFVVED